MPLTFSDPNQHSSQKLKKNPQVLLNKINKSRNTFLKLITIHLVAFMIPLKLV